jgi:hypothetical protein
MHMQNINKKEAAIMIADINKDRPNTPVSGKNTFI